MTTESLAEWVNTELGLMGDNKYGAGMDKYMSKHFINNNYHIRDNEELVTSV